MSDLKEAIKKVLAVKKAQDLLNTFAEGEYDKKFAHVKPKPYDSFHDYHSFEIINENEITINFIYGAGENEYSDSFTVKIS